MFHEELTVFTDPQSCGCLSSIASLKISEQLLFSTIVTVFTDRPTLGDGDLALPPLSHPRPTPGVADGSRFLPSFSLPLPLHSSPLAVHLPADLCLPCNTMASFAPTSGLSSLLKDGTKHISGVDAAVLKNIDACTQLGALVSTSLGPHARRKIVVNRLGKLFVTSDAATILRELEVIHPAAQLLVKAAEAQEREAGDGTAAVVILASALLENAENMLRMGLHTSEIIAGMAACADGVVDGAGDRVGVSSCWAGGSESRISLVACGILDVTCGPALGPRGPRRRLVPASRSRVRNVGLAAASLSWLPLSTRVGHGTDNCLLTTLPLFACRRGPSSSLDCISHVLCAV